MGRYTLTLDTTHTTLYYISIITKEREKMAKKKIIPPMLQIGPSVESIEAARAAINSILNTPASDDNKIQALKTLHHLCQVQGAVVSNNTFTTGE